MTVDTNNLPHNPDELKNILFAMQENYKKEKEEYKNDGGKKFRRHL